MTMDEKYVNSIWDLLKNAIQEIHAVASSKHVYRGFCSWKSIYGQGVQRGTSPGRVQAGSSLSWGWGDILGGCLLVRR